jgi:hypothetical protein
MAPVDLLPTEILAEILKVAQPEKRSRWKIPFEVSTSHVSTHWRNVALDTPHLWTTIDIYSLHSLAWISSYIARSSTLAIDVRFDIWQSDRSSSISTISVLPLVEIVLPHIERWQSFMLFTYQRRTARIILSRLSKATAPAIQRLRISVDGSDDFGPPSQDAPDIFFAGGTPQLSSADIDGLWYLPPLSNLTTLELHSTSIEALPLTYDHFNAIAQTAPCLAHLAIRGVVDVTHWSMHATPTLVMPSICSLLFSNENTLAALFLTSVSVPQLQSLWVDYPETALQQGFFDSPLFVTTDPFPSLRYLTLQSYHFSTVQSYARVFSRITHLHLVYCNVFHITPLRDVLINKDSRWWHHLHTIAIQTTRDQHVKKLGSALEEIIRSRIRDGMPIKKLLLDTDVFLALSKLHPLLERTQLKKLGPTNYEEYWWLLSHQNTRVRL